jgi:hypothetical protein
VSLVSAHTEVAHGARRTDPPGHHAVWRSDRRRHGRTDAGGYRRVRLAAPRAGGRGDRAGERGDGTGGRGDGRGDGGDVAGQQRGRVLFEWNSLDWVPVTDTYAAFSGGTEQAPFDYFHINSIAVGHDGNLVISARNTCAVYKIARSGGEVLWRLEPAPGRPLR